ncbi:MAG: deoxyribodipyrimidine photo-lyase [Vibrio sp.]
MRLVWLRRDLRSIDNAALNRAIKSGEPVAALFIATPKQWQYHDMAPIQADLIYRRLFELQKELNAYSIPLLYRQCDDFTQSVDLLLDVAAELKAKHIYVNKDYELNETLRDQHAEQLCDDRDIGWSGFDDKCVQAPGSVLNQQGEYFKVFTPFKKAWLKQVSWPQITKTVPVTTAAALSNTAQQWLWSHDQVFDYPRVDSGDYVVDFDGIRQQLRSFCHQTVNEYQTQRDYPAEEGTSLLSPYLAIGALSPRQCMARLQAETPSGQLSEGATTWLSEVIWREFYQHLMYFEPRLCKGDNFHRWAKNIQWQHNDRYFQAWSQGRTGYPIVDAAMRQLNNTGWMHNRLRMITASFLTKDLHIHWRHGEQYFMRQLVDGDYAANNGGWQWSASTGCDGQPYFRIFNPTTQSEKFDPTGEFIRRWVPELSALDNKTIHQPWKAEQTLNYPQPIVDHKAEREVTLSLYKQAKGNE